MTNHVHLLMPPSCWSGISRTMQYLGQFYVRYFNFTYRRTGTLFEGRFKSSIIQDRHYLLACQRYIEMNPVRTGMVVDSANYLWSSYRAQAFGINVKMWTPHPEYLVLGSTKVSRMAAYRILFEEELEKDTISEVRNAANTALSALCKTGHPREKPWKSHHCFPTSR